MGCVAGILQLIQRQVGRDDQRSVAAIPVIDQVEYLIQPILGAALHAKIINEGGAIQQNDANQPAGLAPDLSRRRRCAGVDAFQNGNTQRPVGINKLPQQKMRRNIRRIFRKDLKYKGTEKGMLFIMERHTFFI